MTGGVRCGGCAGNAAVVQAPPCLSVSFDSHVEAGLIQLAVLYAMVRGRNRSATCRRALVPTLYIHTRVRPDCPVKGSAFVPERGCMQVAYDGAFAIANCCFGTDDWQGCTLYGYRLAFRLAQQIKLRLAGPSLVEAHRLPGCGPAWLLDRESVGAALQR